MRSARVAASIALLRNLFTVVVLGLIGIVASGCAWIRAEQARSATLDRELDAYVIKKPIAVTWDKVTVPDGAWDQLFWSGKGFTWHDTSKWHARTSKSSDRKLEEDGTLTLKTTWFEAEGQDLGDGSRIHYFEVEDDKTIRHGETMSSSHDRSRRYDLDLELIKLFDPKSAAEIAAKGQRAADAAAAE